ncbi:hypothetical protein ACJX0J_029443, partial [Zea mays]
NLKSGVKKLSIILAAGNEGIGHCQEICAYALGYATEEIKHTKDKFVYFLTCLSFFFIGNNSTNL